MLSPSELLEQTIKHLLTKKKILFLTTSNRWSNEKGGEIAKSTQLAFHIAKIVGSAVTVIDVTKLKIYPCEGDVSAQKGNSCGVKKALLKDEVKNPSGLHRCWASFNNSDDELWKISKELFQSDCVVFFTSVRWGQTNAFYQKLIERLTWIENRHSTLGETNLLANIEAGIIAIGQNWNGANVVSTQKQVLEFFGFQVQPDLCWNWQYIDDPKNESSETYKAATLEFNKIFNIGSA